jgi:hypothetical protein
VHRNTAYLRHITASRNWHKDATVEEKVANDALGFASQQIRENIPGMLSKCAGVFIIID